MAKTYVRIYAHTYVRTYVHVPKIPYTVLKIIHQSAANIHTYFTKGESNKPQEPSRQGKVSTYVRTYVLT